MSGILYVVATPIGNLCDITYRAVEILKSVDFICCEDTRVTARLLQRYIIKKSLISYHQHSKLTKIDHIINELKIGKNIALVSDAGTPCISDPGAQLILEVQKSKIKIITIPGASAIAALYSVSGFTENSFIFLGFLPKKKGRQTILAKIKKGDFNLKKTQMPIIIYESPHRIIKTLRDFSAIGDFQVVVGRELTKKFEEIVKGKISEIISYYSSHSDKLKGEFTICLKQE